MFLYTVVETLNYDQILNANCVATSEKNNENLILLQDSIFPHSIPTFLHANETYFSLLFHERTEFFE